MAWLKWQAVGQAAYLTELSKVDREYSQRLRAFEVDNEQRRTALAAFQQDEQAKAGWVHCPHCNTAWAGAPLFSVPSLRTVARTHSEAFVTCRK